LVGRIHRVKFSTKFKLNPSDCMVFVVCLVNFVG
jgi:hypothetical protein